MLRVTAHSVYSMDRRATMTLHGGGVAIKMALENARHHRQARPLCPLEEPQLPVLRRQLVPDYVFPPGRICRNQPLPGKDLLNERSVAGLGAYGPGAGDSNYLVGHSGGSTRRSVQPPPCDGDFLFAGNCLVGRHFSDDPLGRGDYMDLPDAGASLPSAGPSAGLRVRRCWCN